MAQNDRAEENTYSSYLAKTGGGILVGGDTDITIPLIVGLVSGSLIGIILIIVPIFLFLFINRKSDNKNNTSDPDIYLGPPPKINKQKLGVTSGGNDVTASKITGATGIYDVVSPIANPLVQTSVKTIPATNSHSFKRKSYMATPPSKNLIKLWNEQRNAKNVADKKIWELPAHRKIPSSRDSEIYMAPPLMSSPESDIYANPMTLQSTYDRVPGGNDVVNPDPIYVNFSNISE